MLLQPSSVKRIAIFRALQLGDMLCAIPAIRALHKAFPEASITLLGLPWATSLVSRFHNYIQDFKWFPGFPGLPEQPFDSAATVKFLQEMNDEKYDLAIQMQGNGAIVNPMMELMGAKITAGFCKPGNYCPDSNLYLLYPEEVHEKERHLKLMDNLGIPRYGDHLEFPLFPQDEAELQLSGIDLEPGSYVCIHPGSRGSWRQWPPAFFAMLGDICAKNGKKVVITGTKDEMEIVNRVALKMQATPIIAAGITTLGAMSVLIRDAYALISNCTGPAHIAAALRTPTIVISMDGEPARWTHVYDKIHFALDWTTNPDLDLAISATEKLLAQNLIRSADDAFA